MGVEHASTERPAGGDGRVLHGAGIIEALALARVSTVIAVPDIVTSRGVLMPLSRDPRFRLVRVCKEDECYGIAAALAVCGQRAVSLMQNTGLLDSINALAHVGVQYGLPLVTFVGLLARETERLPRESHRLAVRVVEPMLDALGVATHLLEEDADVKSLAELVERAFETAQPLAVLIGRRPVP